MPGDGESANARGQRCHLVSEDAAFRAFAQFAGKTQSAAHIRPLHWYVACRLVLEGGFDPSDIVPRPPFILSRQGSRPLLTYDPLSATGGERTVLGGLKTKDVDVVVTKDGIGPVLAVSCKGVTGAFRNLTNRMEETIGECTNLHITYPALVLGYLVLIRANSELREATSVLSGPDALPTRELRANDIALRTGGEPVEGIIRFYSALRELTGRKGIRDELSRYEAVALAMIDMSPATSGKALDTFPKRDSPLRLEQFFSGLYARYDERFVYSAPSLSSITRRAEWSSASPILSDPRVSSKELGYALRLSPSAEIE